MKQGGDTMKNLEIRLEESNGTDVFSCTIEPSWMAAVVRYIPIAGAPNRRIFEAEVKDSRNISSEYGKVVYYPADITKRHEVARKAIYAMMRRLNGAHK